MKKRENSLEIPEGSTEELSLFDEDPAAEHDAEKQLQVVPLPIKERLPKSNAEVYSWLDSTLDSSLDLEVMAAIRKLVGNSSHRNKAKANSKPKEAPQDPHGRPSAKKQESKTMRSKYKSKRKFEDHENRVTSKETKNSCPKANSLASGQPLSSYENKERKECYSTNQEVPEVKSRFVSMAVQQKRAQSETLTRKGPPTLPQSIGSEPAGTGEASLAFLTKAHIILVEQAYEISEYHANKNQKPTDCIVSAYAVPPSQYKVVNNPRRASLGNASQKLSLQRPHDPLGATSLHTAERRIEKRLVSHERVVSQRNSPLGLHRASAKRQTERAVDVGERSRGRRDVNESFQKESPAKKAPFPRKHDPLGAVSLHRGESRYQPKQIAARRLSGSNSLHYHRSEMAKEQQKAKTIQPVSSPDVKSIRGSEKGNSLHTSRHKSSRPIQTYDIENPSRHLRNDKQEQSHHDQASCYNYVNSTARRESTSTSQSSSSYTRKQEKGTSCCCTCLCVMFSFVILLLFIGGGVAFVLMTGFSFGGGSPNESRDPTVSISTTYEYYNVAVDWKIVGQTKSGTSIHLDWNNEATPARLSVGETLKGKNHVIRLDSVAYNGKARLAISVWDQCCRPVFSDVEDYVDEFGSYGDWTDVQTCECAGSSYQHQIRAMVTGVDI